ncbi:MAG TPA: ABC transporter permease [Burkholderiaceae bacterium]|nr:ABC transporter permease [Burkholderiaceae bacterium]
MTPLATSVETVVSHAVVKTATPLSPNRRAWIRFKRNRLGVWSLAIFTLLLLISLFSEVLSNDKPLIARYDGEWLFPMLNNPPELRIGGDFKTPIDWSDPFTRQQFAKPGNWMLGTINRHSATSLEYFSKPPNPAPPTADHWLGTDQVGRDMVARLLYGFRVSILFALALTGIGVVLGLMMGAVQGYFAGRVDLTMQRLIEIWTSIPELYLLIIFASIFQPSISLLLILLSLFGWVGLSDYTRAEFLRNRSLEFVKAARALGLSTAQIIWRHVLPNSLTPAVTFLPFRMSAAILSLVALDFLGLGVPPDVPSLGELVKQGKANLDAWWIIFPTFALLVVTMLLLTFIGDALRDAFDTRKS